MNEPMRPPLAAIWGLLLLSLVVAEAAGKLTIVEQVGTVIVPTPKGYSPASATVPVVFEVPFHTNPSVVVTPFFHAYESAAGYQTFVATVFNVQPSGFSLYVERLDQNTWYGGRALVSWIAWDPETLPEGDCGSVPVVPQSDGTGFASNIVVEFSHSSFSLPPAVIATARVGQGDDPLGFGITLSQVTSSYAVLNLAAIGAKERWTELVHVDWRAWPVGITDPPAHNYEAHLMDLKPCEPSTGCIEALHERVPLSLNYPYDPHVLVTVAGGGGGQSGSSGQDTFVASLHNITTGSFEVNVAEVYGAGVGLTWKEPLKLAWVARNTSKVCPDDCAGHGICIDSSCHCDTGWTGNGTCDTCDWGYYGSYCDPCFSFNETTKQLCGGHGVCDGGGTTTGTGQCVCDRGYQGPQCGSCVAGFYPDLVTGACDVCPKADNVTCAGHGDCKARKSNDSSSSEQGYCECWGMWGGDYCAECVRGYAGDDCEDQCPQLCGGRGTCSLIGNDTLACTCDVGWDASSYCLQCAAGFYGGECMGHCQDCGLHGRCLDGLSGDGSCTCDQGYTGVGCDVCDFGFSKETGKEGCVECPGGHLNPCSGHGVVDGCTDGRCICVAGYKGEDCSQGAGLEWWATTLIIVLASALFLALSGLAIRLYFKLQKRRRRRRTGSKSGNYKELDPELRKRLLEQCPELAGLEDALSALGSDAADWLIDFTKLNIGYRIGSGTSSVVFRGLYFGEVVAIKKLQSGKCDPHLFALFFRQEAELLSKLHHPHVIRFYGVCYHEGDFYIVTELCENTLQRILSAQRQEGKRTPLEDIWRIAGQIANGMAYLHSKHVVHRDLKPENVLIDDRGDVKICDFGLSRLMSTDSQMTVQVGTPAFMAPEMANGSEGMSQAVDVYSFGILLWCLATSQNPYFNMEVTPVQLLSRVVAGLRPFIDESIPRELVQMMRMCWDRDANLRPSFDMLVNQLRELLRDEQQRRSFITFSGAAAAASSPPHHLVVETGGGSEPTAASATTTEPSPVLGEGEEEMMGVDWWVI